MPDRINRVGQQVGNYRLLRYLGGGGFGYVYLGEALGSGEQVAIKVLHERLTGSSEFKEFINEARIFRLKHPHITPLLDFGVTSDDVPYLVMEYAPGGTLRNRHPKGTTLALDQVVSYVIPLASALSYAHEQHLVHRDVKPENMLVAADGRLLLSDFGIATVAQSSHLLDLQESVVGTMPYVAPEQLQGKPRPASDQYSLAVVTYEWLTGVRPFNGTQAELFMQHTTTPPPPLREHVPTLPIEVEQVVLTALAKTPGARFATVRAFAHALAQAADVTAPPAPFAIKDAASERFSLFEQPGPAATTPIMSEPLQQASTPPLTGPTQATPLAAAQPSPTHRAPAPALSRRALIAGLIGLSLVGGSAGVIYLTRSATGKAAFSKDTSTATSTAASTATTTHATPSPHATATQAASPSPTATQNNQQLLAQSTIYIGSTDNTLYALNTLDGGVRWNYQGGDWMNSRPAVANNVVYAGCSDHYLYALGALHGDLLWSYRAGDKIVSWPMLANNMLYFGSWDSYVYALQTSSGKLLWRYPIGSSVTAPIQVVDGVVHIGSSDGFVYAIKANDGTLVWRAQTNGGIGDGAAANVYAGVVYIGSSDGSLYALRVSDGKQLWSYQTGNAIYSSPEIAENSLFFGSSDHFIYALRLSDHTVLWRYQAGDAVNSSPTVSNGILYIGSTDGFIYALNAATGHLLWSYQTSGVISSKPLVADGRVYVGASNGLFALQANNGAFVWKFGNGAITTPSIAL